MKAKADMKDQWDMLVLGDTVPVASAPLESIYPNKEQNPCAMKV